MTRFFVPSVFALACLTMSASTASAQSLLNPLSWFGPQQGYGQANCANGFCATPTVNQNCANGQCNVPAYCPNGVCPPANRPYYGTQPVYNNMQPGYSTQPGYNAQPYYGNAPYMAPRPAVPAQYMPYSAQRPVSRAPAYDRSVTPAGGFDWDTPTTVQNRRGYSPSSSPFYP